PVIDFGSVKVLRYQPRPPGAKPLLASVPAPGALVMGSSMLQSCGTSSLRHAESSYVGDGASAYAPDGSGVSAELTRASRQSLSNDRLRISALLCVLSVS